MAVGDVTEAALRHLLPTPLRALAWRLPWVRTTDPYAVAPLATWLRAARFTLRELAGGEQRFRTPDGLDFASMPNNFSSFALFVGGARDPIIWRFIRRRLSPGAIFVDAGANIGAYAVPAARLVGPEGHVIAIEAHPAIFRYLARNIAANNLAQVSALNRALGAAPGRVRMAFNAANPGETHIADAVGPADAPEVCIETLDATLAELGIARIDYLKIDVEGFELPVLEGARGILAASPRVAVQTELQARHAERYGHSIEAIGALLRDLGLAPHGIDHAGAPYPREELTGDVIWLRPGH